MRLGILSDTHDELDRTLLAIQLLRDAGADVLVHCGDLAGPPIVAALAALPSYFVLGNHDADNVPALRRAAAEYGPVCLGWSGVVELAGRRIGIVHGHMTSDLRQVLGERPDFLLSGHLHFPMDEMIGTVRRINPGALFRADVFTVALLEPATGELRMIQVNG